MLRVEYIPNITTSLLRLYGEKRVPSLSVQSRCIVELKSLLRTSLVRYAYAGRTVLVLDKSVIRLGPRLGRRKKVTKKEEITGAER